MDLVWRTVKRRVTEIVPYEKNPRFITEENKEKLVKSLQKFNLVEIPVINKDGTLIAGHQRLKVLLLLGRGDEMIDVRIPNRMLDEKELKEYNITSNIQSGYWDVDILKAEFTDIDLLELGLNIDEISMPSGLEAAKFDLPILDILEQVEKSEPPLPPRIPISVEGDLYELHSLQKGLIHRVHCGDSRNADHIQKLLEGIKVSLMVTDPPYGVNYDPNWRASARMGKIASTGKVLNDDQANWADTWALISAPVAYVWHAAKFAADVQNSLETNGYDIIAQIIWNKNSLVLSRGDYHWKHEPCLYAVKKGKHHNWQGARDQSTVWDIQNLTARNVIESEGQTGHGTQKPLECMRRPIMNNSQRGDNIADPFLGSGTTLIASEETGRNCFGQELSPGYVDVIIGRWVNFMNDNHLKFKILLNGVEYDPTELIINLQ